MKNDLIKVDSNLPAKGSSTLEKSSKLQGRLSELKTSLNKNEVIPRIYNQLVLFVLDGSRSMRSDSIKGISKAQDIHENVQLVLDRLRGSKNRSSFDIGMIAFSDECINVFGIKELKDVSESQSFNSLSLLNNPGGTKFLPALSEAESMINQYFSSITNQLPRNALVLLMTDGVMDDYQDSLLKAEELKLMNHVTISVMYLEALIEDGSKWYGWDEVTGEMDYSLEFTIDEVRERRGKRAQKLVNYASSQSGFMVTMDADGVRNHMIKSISDTSHLI